MFSHVFPAVGIQNVKVQKDFWKRFDPLPDVTYMTSSNAAALCTQNDRCMTSKHRESYREQTAPTDLYIMMAPHAFESLSRYFDVMH